MRVSLLPIKFCNTGSRSVWRVFISIYSLAEIVKCINWEILAQITYSDFKRFSFLQIMYENYCQVSEDCVNYSIDAYDIWILQRHVCRFVSGMQTPVIIMVIPSMLCFPGFLTAFLRFPWCFRRFLPVFLRFSLVFLPFLHSVFSVSYFRFSVIKHLILLTKLFLSLCRLLRWNTGAWGRHLTTASIHG